MPVLLIRDERKQLGLEAAGGREDLCGAGHRGPCSAAVFLFREVSLQPKDFPPASASLPSLHRLLPHSSLSFLVTYFQPCRQMSHHSLGKRSQGKDNISSSGKRRFCCGVFFHHLFPVILTSRPILKHGGLRGDGQAALEEHMSLRSGGRPPLAGLGDKVLTLCKVGTGSNERLWKQGKE